MSEKSTTRTVPALSTRLFQFFGSMELAITLLLTLAVASVIGTVLQQNQPYSDYIIKFGPFWFDVFKWAGLYDVYSALWFLAILALLVVSTSVCLIRHTPSMLKDMWQLRTSIQKKSLAAMHHNQQWQSEQGIDQTAKLIEEKFTAAGYRTRQTEKDGHLLVSAMRGGTNRLGYIFTHVAIIVICVGGLMDSNLPLKLAEWQGKLKIETQDLPLNKIPAISQLPPGPQAFRGSVSIPEGSSSAVTFLGMRDGYLVQQLPFTLEVKQFRIEHYPTGQPKSFETDLLVHDKDLETPLAATISVNHPLIYKGYAIYQASFADGGSKLDLQAWPLVAAAGNKVVDIHTKVFEKRKMRWGDKSLQLEMTEFRMFNINPDPTADNPDKVRDYGPSIGFKLRQATGEAIEYVNYMYPVERDGRAFFLSGVRNSPAEEFAYLYIPADSNDSLQGFNDFLQALRDPSKVELAANAMVETTLSNLNSADSQLGKNLHDSLITLVKMFVDGGFAEVRRFVETQLPEAERETLGPAYLSMMREILSRIYFANLGVQGQQSVDPEQVTFLQDAIDAIGTLPSYGSPVFLSLSDFEQRQASGLQIARSPGKPVVYLGCALLTAGIFLLFYVPQRRFWAWVEKEQQGTAVVLAGMSNRNPREFDGYFEQVTAFIRQDEAGTLLSNRVHNRT